MAAKGESRSLPQLCWLFPSSHQSIAIRQWISLGSINAKPRAWKEFPSITCLENQLFPKMHHHQSLEARQTWVSDAILCLWSFRWPINSTSPIRFEKFVWKWIQLQRANSLHHLTGLWSKYWASRICRDSCWKIEFPWISYGWWPKWNCYRACKKCSQKRWVGVSEKSPFGYLMASKSGEGNQNAQSRQEIQALADKWASWKIPINFVTIKFEDHLWNPSRNEE